MYLNIHTPGAVPFLSMLGVLALWFCISVPLVFLGKLSLFIYTIPCYHLHCTLVVHRIGLLHNRDVTCSSASLILLSSVYLGAYFGYKKDPLEFPVVTSNIPRQIPEQPW